MAGLLQNPHHTAVRGVPNARLIPVLSNYPPATPKALWLLAHQRGWSILTIFRNRPRLRLRARAR
jgi:hypothetical protein